MAANMATIFGDGIGLQQRPHPYTSPCCPLKAKSFRNTAAYQKLWERVPLTPLVPPCTTWGYEFACTPED